jgi:hypothetical protein
MSINGSTMHPDVSRIPVAYLILGWENNRNAIINFIRNARTGISFVTDTLQLPACSNIDWLWDEIHDARQRGVKFRKITDITKDNLSDCKKNMARVYELRHLEGIRAVFGISDTEAIAMVPLPAPREDFNQIQFIQSDSESVLKIKQLIFDALWTRAIPAQSRIDELEGKKGFVSGDKSIEALHPRKEIIDRIYVCIDCQQTFIYASEVEDHKENEGHENFRDFPIV